MLNRVGLDLISPGKPYFPQNLDFHTLYNPWRDLLFMSLFRQMVFAGGSREPVKDLRILEVGSRGGGSTLAWLELIRKFNGGFGRVLCVDLWRDIGKPHEGEAYFNIFSHNVSAVKGDDVVIPVIGNSHEVLPLLAERSFDLIYVDGGHSYSACFKDVTNAKRLVKEGGIVFGDDMVKPLSEFDPEYVRMNKETDDYTLLYPGVALAIHEHFPDVAPYHCIWAAKKRPGDAFDAIDIPKEIAGKYYIPEYFPKWASRDSIEVLGIKRHECFLTEWQAVACKGRGAVLYGAGQHSAAIIPEIAAAKLKAPRFIIDDDPKTESLQGIPVRRSSDVKPSDFDCLVVSSHVYNAAMAERASQLWPGKEIVDPYAKIQ